MSKPEQTRSDAADLAPPCAGRRRVVGTAVAAPVVLTLVSRPVLAGQCLSNMMSGNLNPSTPDRGNCAKGWSPGGWGQPGGMIGSWETAQAWSVAGFQFGDFTPTACLDINNPKKEKTECYANGSTLANVPGALIKDPLSTFPLGISTELRIVVAKHTGTTTAHLVTAYLNANLSANSGGLFTYILTPQQVLDLATGAIVIPYGSSLNAFLDSTWV